jgi:hypothetical protein
MEKQKDCPILGEEWLTNFKNAGLSGAKLIKYYQTDKEGVTDVLQLSFDGGELEIRFYFGIESTDGHVSIHLDNSKQWVRQVEFLQFKDVDWTPEFESMFIKRLINLIREMKGALC